MLTLAHGGHEHVESLVATAPAIAGLVAGAAHCMLGPDHLAAVAPMAVRRQRAWVSGCLWGLGHSAGVWVLALLALIFREAVPLEALSAWSEVLVGVVLIAVGLWGVRSVMRLHVHSHAHTHAGVDGAVRTHAHTHAHAVAIKGEEHTHAEHDHRHGLLGIGALHGFAGTSHLLGVLPALAMPNRAAAVAYVICFGLGSIVGMGVFTSGLGMLLRATETGSGAATRGLLSVTSLAAVGVGVFWLIPG